MGFGNVRSLDTLVSGIEAELNMPCQVGATPSCSERSRVASTIICCTGFYRLICLRFYNAVYYSKAMARNLQ